MEDEIRAIVRQTVVDAKDQSDRLIQEALECHDALAPMGPELAALQQEEDALRAQMARLKALRLSEALVFLQGALAVVLQAKQVAAEHHQEKIALRARMTILLTEIRQEACIRPRARLEETICCSCFLPRG